MKKFCTTLSFFLLLGVSAYAQQDPQFSQNMHTKLLVNPAFAGANDAYCATLLYRTQWVGFDGAPSTGLLSLDGPFFPKTHGAIGINLATDQLGYEKNTLAKLAYAYRINAPGGGKLAIGVDLGLFQKSLDNNHWVSTQATQLDNAIPDGGIQKTNIFDFDFGLYYNTQKLYVGVSSSHLSESAVKFDSITTYMARHYYLMAGYTFEMSPDLSIMPSTLIKSDAATTQVDFNCNLLYKQMFWGGVSYRIQDAIVAMVGIQNMGIQGLKFGYSYDITTSAIKGYSSGTHEIMLGYCFKKAPVKHIEIIKNVRFL